jgi:uncharacterized protein YkwD
MRYRALGLGIFCSLAAACYAGSDSDPDSGATIAGTDSGESSADDDSGGSASASASGTSTSTGASTSTSADDDGTDDGSSAEGADESSSGGEDPIDVPDNAYCANVAAWDAPWVAWEEEVLALVNAERATGGSCGGQPFGPSSPLEMQPNLRCSARVHSKDMNDRGFFDHTNPDGDGPDERAQMAGFGGPWVGENIASGQMSPSEVMAAWMDSPGHCSNILNGDYAWIGVGYYPGGQWGHLWTQVFGVP